MSNKNILYKFSECIVDKRKVIIMFFIIASVISCALMSQVQVNTDISSYLPQETETKRGVDLMDKEFVSYATTNIMVSNVSYKQAEEVCDIIEAADGVKSVIFDDDEDHYKNASALFEVTLNEADDLDRELEIIDGLKETLSGYDTYFYSETIDDSSKRMDDEMGTVMIFAGIVVLTVLLLTSQSFMEVPVFLLTFAAGAVINMGTNYFLGEISSITKSIAVVLQLALGLDYSIILSHRFTEEKQTKNKKDAIIAALSKALIEISSSSLTTIAGLAALTLMQLRIGMDLGIVLCKGIVCSLLSVFLLMPGLLLMFSDIIDKTKHRNFIPSIEKWCKLVVKLRYVVPIIFVVVIAVCAVMSSNTQFSFDTVGGEPSRPTEKSIAMHKIQDTFGEKHSLAVIVPVGEYANEKRMIDEITELDNVAEVNGLSNTELEDGYTLTQPVTPREFADIMELDYSMSKLLFQAYGMENEEYNAILGDVSEYTVAPIDLVFFMKDYIDKGVVTLNDEDKADMDEMFDMLSDARKQLEGENYARIAVMYSCPVESDEAYELHEEVRRIALKYYPDVTLVGNTISCKDLGDSFSSDNQKITLTTALAVLLILLFTFKSVSLPVLLILVIQGSIWINFSVPYLTKTPLFFLGYLIVSSIQMGSTIDYAIVFTNRYLALKKETNDIKKAAIDALNQSFPTILTSGSILTIIGFLLGKVSTDSVVSSLGTVLGRGALISIILVMLVLPQIIILADKIIEKTFFTMGRKTAEKTKEQIKNSTTYVDGKIQGYVCGYVYGNLYGVIRGDVDAKLDTMKKNGEGQIDDRLFLDEGEK